MRVLLVNGSAHVNGNTFTALREVARTLECYDIETEIFQIGNKPVRGCIACGICRKNGNNRCSFDDDVTNSLIKAAEKTDAFVFGSPTYWGQPNGSLMAVVQRALYAGRDCFVYKPFANVVVCRRGGASAVFNTMNMPFEMLNMPYVTSQYWNIAYGRTPGEAALDVEGMQTMRTLAHNMSWMLKKFNDVPTSYRPEKEAPQVMHFVG